MDIFSILTLVGGLALFLYGMNVMSSGLERMAGGRLEHVLRRMTDSKVKGMTLGAGVTAVIQSSSAVTVMLVGLVNAGIMQLSQAISVVFGSNIGTTMTAWILSLAGIESDSVWIQLLKPSSFSPLVALIGVILLMSKKQRRRDTGTIFIGFAVLMFGMDSMSGAVEPLAESPAFAGLLTAFQNPILALLIGALFTAVIQSSSASVGVLQALAMTGDITFGMAIPIIMGQNIGTCISAVIATTGTNRAAKRVSVVHVLFNAIGSIVCLSVWCVADAIFNFAFADGAVTPFYIAVVHTAFNVVTVSLLFPCMGLLEKLACRIIPDAKEAETEELLDERLMQVVPAFAVEQAMSTTVDMARMAHSAVMQALDQMTTFTEERAQSIMELEGKLDYYEDKLGSYLVKLSQKEVTEAENKQITRILHSISDFERIGDHASDLLKLAEEMRDKQVTFSHEAQQELACLVAALREVLDIATQAFEQNDSEKASLVEPLEQVIDALIAEIKSRHILRLQKGGCTIEFGFILMDLLNNYERISDHCSNVAVAVIEAEHGTYDSHGYLSAVKSEEDGSFAAQYEQYRTKYSLS